MSISATFTANFTAFNAAVQQADAKLKDFGEGADKVGGKLSRFANEFSGRRLIQEATVMAEAVERIGGTSKLTQQELARVGAKAQEASAKMKALGMEVPAGIQKIASETQNLTAKQTDLLGSLTKVAGAFGIAFGAQQVVGFIGKVFSAADAIQDVADRLGISTDAVQEFTYALKQSGGTMEDLERGLFEMTKQLGTGDKSTLAALQAVGVEFDTVRRLSPEDAFRALAEGVGRVHDPMLQAKLGTELFGNAWKEIAPAVNSGALEVARSVDKLSKDTIQGLAAAQKAWEDFGNAAVVHSGNMLSAMGNLPGVLKDIVSSKENFAVFLGNLQKFGFGAAIGMAGITKEAKAAEAALPPMAKTLGKTTEELKDAEEAARKFADQQKQSVEAMREFRNFIGVRQMEDARAAMDAQAKAVEAAVELEFELNKLYVKNAAALGAYAGNVGLYTEQWAGYSTLAPGVVKHLTASGKALIEVNRGLSDSMKSLMAGDFTQVSKDIGSFFKGGLSSIGTGFLESIGSGMLNMVSGLAMKGLSALGTQIGKLFGVDKQKKELDALRQGFIDVSGGWDALNKSADQAGTTLARVLNAKTVKEYEAALKDLQGAIAFQESAMATLDETAKRYGFTLEELGPAMQRQELDKQAQQLFKDWEVLNAAAIDTVAITSRMSEEINAYVAHATAMGTEVPAAMKPMLEEMVRMGQLTDASGNRIDNLEDSGISFAMTMSDGFKKLIDEVGKLTQAIARGLGLALDTTSDKLRNLPTTIPIDVDVRYNDPGYAGFTAPEPAAVPGFATGTHGNYLNFGSGTLAMLHGREKITPAGAPEGGDVSELRAEVQGLRADLARQNRLLPKQLRDALLLAS